MFQFNHTIFRELIIRACQSYTVLKQSFIVHQCMTAPKHVGGIFK